jgi:hypothetical protein
MSNTWKDRARDAALNGFTFDALMHEIVGRASTLMAGDREFDDREATQVAVDAEAAVLEFLRVAINQQSIDAAADMADWEIAELIGQAPCFGMENPDA